MALTFTLTRSFKIPGDENIGIATGGLKADFEFGSIEEAHGYFQEKETPVRAMFGFSIGDRVDFTGPAEQPQGDQALAAEPKTRKPRTPKVEAIAPPPLPVPTQATTTTVLPLNQLAPADDGIPAYLKRDATNNLPPSPPPAPLPPTAPPVGLLGLKVVTALETRKANAPDGGQALADWLAAHGLTIPGASFDEACKAVVMISDEKLRTVADQLQVAA